MSTVGALTIREGEILQLVAGGLTDRQIAGSLGLARRTVSDHVGTILLKLSAKRRAEAVGMAIGMGLIDPPPTIEQQCS